MAQQELIRYPMGVNNDERRKFKEKVRGGMAEKITSRHNPIVKELQAVRDGKASGLILLEGPRLVAEAVKSSLDIDTVVCTSTMRERAAGSGAKRSVEVSDSVFRAVSDVDAPQGLLAVARRPSWRWPELLGGRPGLVLVLDGVQDPGNLATIIRTAEAAGAAGVVTSPDSARVFSPKALRSGAGASLRLPSLEHRPVSEILEELKKAGRGIFAAATAVPDGDSVPYTDVDWTKPIAVVLGQEGSGLSGGWEAERSIHIPMKPPVESLNVAAAAAVILYEAQRRCA